MRLIVLTVPMLLLFYSCSLSNDPVPAKACFDYTPSGTICIGDEITLTNCSENASNYSWDFGNGESSSEESPKVSFSEIGSYEVQLTAIGENENSLSKTIFAADFPDNFTFDETYFNIKNTSHRMRGLTFTGSYGHDLIFMTSGLSLIKTDNHYRFYGKGDFLLISMYSNNDQTITEGVYHYSNTSPSSAGKFSGSVLALDYDAEEGMARDFIDIYGGNVTISYKNNLLMAEFNLMSFNDLPIEGEFRGVPFSFEDLNDKSLPYFSINQ